MTLDFIAAETMRRSLLDSALPAAAVSSALDSSKIETMLDAFAIVTPPEEPRDEVGFITIDSLYAPTGRSQKPGNIILNWRKLMDIIPDVTLAGIGAVTLPFSPTWVLPLAALYVWNKVRNGLTEEFSDAEATCIVALWKGRNEVTRISEEEGLQKTNEIRIAGGLQPLSKTAFAAVIDRLVKIRCIELSEGSIWLREWTRIKYRA